jgi:hypothetical protein
MIGLSPIVSMLSLTIKKQEIREKMREELEVSTELQTLQIPSSAVVWMDEHEIWVDNHMFDIHSRVLKNGMYTFTGLFDEEETQMIEDEQEQNAANENQSRMLGKVYKTMQLGFYEPVFSFEYVSEVFEINNSPYCVAMTDIFPEIITPPPRIFA